jgi:hypothetical protein
MSGYCRGTGLWLSVPAQPVTYGAPFRVLPRWDVRNVSLAFVIGEGQQRIPVRYKGVRPDMYQPVSSKDGSGPMGCEASRL